MMDVINIVNAHTADVLVSIMMILSKKYGHSVEEMMEVVRTNPSFHAIQIHPILTAEFFERPAPISSLPIVPVAAPAPTPVPVNPLKKPVRVVKRVVKKATELVTDASENKIEPPLRINSDLESPRTRSPISPLSEVVVMDCPPVKNSEVITMPSVEAQTPVPVPVPVLNRKTNLVLKKKPAIEADTKEVKPHSY